MNKIKQAGLAGILTALAGCHTMSDAAKTYVPVKQYVAPKPDITIRYTESFDYQPRNFVNAGRILDKEHGLIVKFIQEGESDFVMLEGKQKNDGKMYLKSFKHSSIGMFFEALGGLVYVGGVVSGKLAGKEPNQNSVTMKSFRKDNKEREYNIVNLVLNLNIEKSENGE